MALSLASKSFRRHNHSLSLTKWEPLKQNCDESLAVLFHLSNIMIDTIQIESAIIAGIKAYKWFGQNSITFNLLSSL